MKKKELVIKVVVFSMFAAGLVMGLIYLLRPTLMPFHFAFLGKTQDQLEPRTFELMMTMKRVIGAHFLAISFGVLLLAGRLAKGDVFVRWSVLVMVLISQLILLYAGYIVQNGIVLKSVNVIEIVLVLFIFFFSKRREAETK
jgi:hypothetical protein